MSAATPLVPRLLPGNPLPDAPASSADREGDRHEHCDSSQRHAPGSPPMPISRNLPCIPCIICITTTCHKSPQLPRRLAVANRSRPQKKISRRRIKTPEPPQPLVIRSSPRTLPCRSTPSPPAPPNATNFANSGTGKHSSGSG